MNTVDIIQSACYKGISANSGIGSLHIYVGYERMRIVSLPHPFPNCSKCNVSVWSDVRFKETYFPLHLIRQNCSICKLHAFVLQSGKYSALLVIVPPQCLYVQTYLEERFAGILVTNHDKNTLLIPQEFAQIPIYQLVHIANKSYWQRAAVAPAQQISALAPV